MSSVQKHTLRIVEDIVDGVSQWFSYRFFFGLVSNVLVHTQ